MNQNRRLSLKREALAELTNDDLGAVLGANALTTDCKTWLRPSVKVCSLEDCSNTWACTGGCA